MKQSLGLDLRQKQTLTPALRQAIRMLHLSTLDLQSEVQEALESNVMLEDGGNTFDADTDADANNGALPDGEEYEPVLQKDGDIPESLPLDANWNDIYSGDTVIRSAAEPGYEPGYEDLREYAQVNLTSTPDLHTHLTWQAELHPFTPEQQAIAEVIIDAIGPGGLLMDWDSTRARIAEEFGITTDEVDAELKTIQAFDPPGVGARSLSECLMLQLDNLPDRLPGRDLALSMIHARAFHQLATGDHDTLARRFETSTVEVEAAIRLIRSLNLYPGDSFGEQEATYVVPEVLATRSVDGWQVTLNPEIIPSVRLNRHYMSLIKRADRSEEQVTLKTHLQEARFFLYSLRSRNETLLGVARCIVESQRDFLEHGEEAMKPLVLHDVAEQLDVHESTVSRATANKYMQTPRGVFALKYFFSSHVSTTDGGVISAVAIQAMIKRLVSNEPPEKPLSDQKLTQALLDKGVQVARRTVAKYREAMLIPSSRERRRSPG